MDIGKRKLAVIVLSGLILLAGCTPRVIVHSHPNRDTKGIRYYRPKPYLKIEPAEVAVDKSRTELVPGMVRVSLVYLPDFSEEYAIDVRPGLGVANVGIKLEDGWNLTEISQDLDSQTDENLKAFGSLISSIGDVVPSSTGTETNVSFMVQGRNVPIGFYESVIGRDDRDCKRLYGFRYLGFIPFSNCPVDMGGRQQQCCDDVTQPMYGLTFRDGQMVFEPLDVMATTPAQQADVQTSSRIVRPVNSSDDNQQGSNQTLTDSERQKIERELRRELQAQGFQAVSEVRAIQRNADIIVTIGVSLETPPQAIRDAALKWLTLFLGTDRGFDVEINPGTVLR